MMSEIIGKIGGIFLIIFANNATQAKINPNTGIMLKNKLKKVIIQTKPDAPLV